MSEFFQKIPRWAWITAAVVVVAIIGGVIYSNSQSSSVASGSTNTNSATGNSVSTNNTGNVQSTQQNVMQQAYQPFH